MSLTDFPDSFSPMLVKDLRIMLKSDLFVRSFILLHITLVTLTMLQLFGGLGSEFSWIFWPLTSLFCLTTLRECSFEKSEDVGKNMELIRVSGLSAWQIMFGKWCTSCGLLILFVASILPYLVFRYFTGNSELLYEFVALVIISMSLSTLAAITLGFTSSPSPTLRAFMLITIAAGGYRCFISIFLGNWLHLVFIFLMFLFLTGFSILAGASRLEESTVVHSIFKRLFLLGFALVILTLSWTFESTLIGTTVLLFITTFAILDCLSDRKPNLYVAISHFASRKHIKWLAHCLIPGWPSTVLLAVICLAITILECRFERSVLMFLLIYLFVWSFTIFPLCLTIWLSRRTNFSKKALYITAFILYCVLVYNTALKQGTDWDLQPILPVIIAYAIFAIMFPLLIGFPWYKSISKALKS